MTYYLAIDIGASSGRHIIGWQENGVLHDKEVYRFHNGVEMVDGHLTWNIEKLFKEVKAGIREAYNRRTSIHRFWAIPSSRDRRSCNRALRTRR